MLVDIRVPVGLPILQTADFIARCEDAGFDGVGVHDHPHSGRDVYVTLAIAAERTRIARLYPATSSPIVRHPLLLASAAQSLEEIAPGRICLTIAPGFLAARSIGRPRATLAIMREAIITVRRLLAGETVRLEASQTRLRNRSPMPTPVYLLASGPRMTELAGEVADGVMLLVGFHRGIVDAVLTHLEQGARKSGRRLEDLEIIWAVRTGMAPTMAEARRMARPTVVHQGIMRVHSRWLEYTKLSIPHYEIPPAVWKIYPDLSHAQNWDEAIEATSFVPDEIIGQLCDALGLIGTPEHCARRIADLTGAGVKSLYIMPLQTFVGPEQEIRAFRDAVFPALKAAGLR